MIVEGYWCRRKFPILFASPNDRGKRGVVIFTQPDCLPCDAVKLFLEDRGVAYVEKGVVASPGVAREMVEKYSSRSTPTLIIGSEVLIGFDPERIDELLAR
jgi:glutaredoxin